MSWDQLRHDTPLSAIMGMNPFRRRNRQDADDFLPAAHHTIYDHISDGIFIVTPNNLLVSFNPAAGCILTSIVSEEAKTATNLLEIIGKPIQEVLAMWPTIGPFLNSTDKEHTTSVESMCREGARSFELCVIPIHTDRDHFSGRMLLLRETTERNSAARALQQRKQQLRQMVEHLQKTESMRSSHAEYITQEVRTSLTRIDLHINSLRQEIGDNWGESINRIEHEISSLYTGLESLLQAKEFSSVSSSHNSSSSNGCHLSTGVLANGASASGESTTWATDTYPPNMNYEPNSILATFPQVETHDPTAVQIA
ncbi:MAG: hypothetical protein AAF702_30610 [Chloroflexota bacterium]